ncbi:MAG: anti-sigma factor RsbA family regulatory protein [Thermoleophilaceae bacterium]
MSTIHVPVVPEPPLERFRHEALFYEGEEGFLEVTLPFIRDAIAQGEPILVVVSARRIELLREALGDDAEAVSFADMAEVGANPARIIPAWHDFVEEHAAPGRRLRGIGEPVYAERSAAELVECQRHEELLNVAFEGADCFWLVCPYDTSSLRPDILRKASLSHPFGQGQQNPDYRGLGSVAAPFADPLPEPGTDVHEVMFTRDDLSLLRGFVAEHAAAAGLEHSRSYDLVLAVNVAATNSVRHAGGRGLLRVWREDPSVICEVRDTGLISAPLAGRVRPDRTQVGGHGLWLVNQLCDLAQVRSGDQGSIVRLHMHAR